MKIAVRENMEEAAAEKSSKKKIHISNSGKFFLTVIVILLALTLFFAWKYNNEKKQVKKLSNPQAAVKSEADALKDKVDKLVDLPDETPTIATVTDITKLKSQTFFAKAQNGDKVLIFTKAQRAVLYRPSTNKVIEYAPVNLGNTGNGTSTNSNSNKQ